VGLRVGGREVLGDDDAARQVVVVARAVGVLAVPLLLEPLAVAFFLLLLDLVAGPTVEFVYQFQPESAN
jgi:hypothetical protein